MNRAKIVSIILAVTLLSLCAVGTARELTLEKSEAYAASVYDELSPELIKLYEREIAGSPIVSDKSQAYLERTAARLSISVSKLKAVMLLQDLSAQLGEDISLSTLAAMNDFEIVMYAKNKGEKYLGTLSPERVEELKTLLLAALKN